ncbi:MAG: isocitrate/isopropylmalate family dehydrogenase, partial [Dokdonella sp.]
MKAHIAVLPGDGIGPEVISAAVEVLQDIARRHGHEFAFSDHPIGGNANDAHGEPLPASTLAAC